LPLLERERGACRGGGLLELCVFGGWGLATAPRDVAPEGRTEPVLAAGGRCTALGVEGRGGARIVELGRAGGATGEVSCRVRICSMTRRATDPSSEAGGRLRKELRLEVGVR